MSTPVGEAVPDCTLIVATNEQPYNLVRLKILLCVVKNMCLGSPTLNSECLVTAAGNFNFLEELVLSYQAAILWDLTWENRIAKGKGCKQYPSF
ncbi:unnamed protein product [Orchesella dallaii]|uniref:Uncharacterized protein n=1 Tax=Orchesella dallaii TaxID=48710 RepID=A0ABP1R0D4_9HEXA